MRISSRARLAPGRLAAAFVALTLSAAVAAQQPAQKERKLDKAQQSEIQALISAVDRVSSGQPAPADIPVAFDNHYMKARDARTYVPFIVTIDPAKLASPSLAAYLRVVKKGADSAAGDAATPAARQDGKAVGEYAFEDVYFVEAKPEVGQQHYRLQRAFSAPGGEYDVYVALKERAGKDKTAAPALTVFKQAVSVPDFWNKELATSSIILADKVDELPAGYTEAQQVEHPYTLDRTQIVPSPDRKFTKKENLSIVFMIYNAAVDANKKPDITVDYGFYVKSADGTEKFFNRTNPQAFNASTVQPQFDQDAGHQLAAGQEVPLASFPDGTFRLEIKVTDKLANKSLIANATFSVTAG